MATIAEKRRRLLAFIFGLIECLFLAGGIYGWVALVYILKQDGVYSHLCVNSSATDLTYDPEEASLTANTTTAYPTCQAQDELMNLCFTIGNFALQGSTLITGALFDKFGLRITRICGTFVYVAGCLMLGFASADLPILVFPGLICFGMGGIQLLVTNMQIGNYFVKVRLAVVTVYNAAFDASSTTPLLMKILYDQHAVSRFYSFIGLAILALIIVGTSTLCFLPKFKIQPRGQPRAQVKREGDEIDIAAEHREREPLESVKESGGRSLKSCVFSLTYVLAVWWHGLLQLRFYMYLGSLNVWLQIVAKTGERISTFINVFSMTLMGGLLMGPLEGLILGMEERRLKKPNMTYQRKLKMAAVPKLLCCLFGLVLSVTNLFTSPALLYVQFISLTAMRSFLYGLNAAFLFLAFPAEHFGKLFGILMTFNAFTASTQYGLFKWSEGPPRDPYPVNVFLLVLVVISLIQPLYLWFAEKIPFLTKRQAQSNGAT